MNTQQMISDPLLQRILIGLLCGLLIGFSHRISRRFLEAGAALVAIAILFFMITGQPLGVEDIQFDVIIQWITGKGYEIAGLFAGLILGYSVNERSRGGK